MAFTVVYDANVLYPASLRDLLLEMASSGVFRARLTIEILDELFEHLADDHPAELEPWAIERLSADDFVMRLLDDQPEIVVDAITRISARLSNPARTALDLSRSLERAGLNRAAPRLRLLLP